LAEESGALPRQPVPAACAVDRFSRRSPGDQGFDALGLPVIVKASATNRVACAGHWSYRSGKSTTLAAMLDKINSEREEHMITIEDRSNFCTSIKSAFVNQREVHSIRTPSRIHFEQRSAKTPMWF